MSVNEQIIGDEASNDKLGLEAANTEEELKPGVQGNERPIKTMLFEGEEENQKSLYNIYTEVNDSIIWVQSQLRIKLARKKYAEMKLIRKLSKQRTQVVMELYSTEINYVSNLEKIVNCFMKPLRAIFDESKKGGITKESIDAIFCNIEDILLKHQDFLKKLKQIVDQWSNETLLSPLFENIHEYISTYIPYFNNYENSYVTIEKCMKVPAFEESIKMVEGVKKLERNDLKSLLILPVQRIPRYILYLKEILKHTWTSHPDYDGLKIEISRIDEDIKVLNRWKKFSESKGVIELLQSQIKRQNIEVKGKKYVSEGSVYYQYSIMKETLKTPLPTYIYLFNDMLLLTKTSVSKFTRISRLSIIKAIPLTGIQIGDLSQTNNPEFQHCLSLTLQDHSILSLYLENAEQKEKWYDDFQRVLYHIHSEMSDLMTIGDDDSFSNSQILSIGEDDKEGSRLFHNRFGDYDDSAVNSPILKPDSPFRINSSVDKRSDYLSEEDSPRSPDKKKDSVRKKKGKEKLSPDKDNKGFFSHVKNLIDESKVKFERGSLDSLDSPSEKKSGKSSVRKYKSKDSLNLNEGDTTVHGSLNSIISKKLSLRDNTLGSSQISIERVDEDSGSTKLRDNTETSSVNDNSPLDYAHSIELRNSDIIRESEGSGREDDDKSIKSSKSGRRNGQGYIFDKNLSKKDSEIYNEYEGTSSHNSNSVINEHSIVSPINESPLDEANS